MDYHKDFSALSKTALSVFLDDPYKYYLEFVAQSHTFPKKQTRQLTVGVACHAVLLEGKQLMDVVAIYPKSCLNSAGGINPKPAELFRIEQGHKLCVKSEDFDRMVQILASVNASPLGDLIAAATEREEEHRAEILGIKCKCRPDFAAMDYYGRNLIWDLKFQDDCSKKSFRRSAKNFRYWLQDAHYSAICREENDLPTSFQFWIVEAHSPFRVRTYHFSQPTRDEAFSTHLRKLEELKACIESGVWESHDDHEVVLGPGEMDWQDTEEEFQG